jgi:hypothetical protein
MSKQRRKKKYVSIDPNTKVIKGKLALVLKKNGNVKYDKHGNPIYKGKHYVMDNRIDIRAERDITIFHYPKKVAIFNKQIGTTKDGTPVYVKVKMKLPGEPVIMRVIPKDSVIRKQQRSSHVIQNY